jgi:hypothetical protein
VSSDELDLLGALKASLGMRSPAPSPSLAPKGAGEDTETGPGEEFWDREPATDEERECKYQAIGDQTDELGDALNVRITCPCGFAAPLYVSCRCFFCGIYFCRRCAARHFAVPHGQVPAPSPNVNPELGEAPGDAGEGAELPFPGEPVYRFVKSGNLVQIDDETQAGWKSDLTRVIRIDTRKRMVVPRVALEPLAWPEARP